MGAFSSGVTASANFEPVAGQRNGRSRITVQNASAAGVQAYVRQTKTATPPTGGGVLLSSVNTVGGGKSDHEFRGDGWVWIKRVGGTDVTWAADDE